MLARHEYVVNGRKEIYYEKTYECEAASQQCLSPYCNSVESRLETPSVVRAWHRE